MTRFRGLLTLVCALLLVACGTPAGSGGGQSVKQAITIGTGSVNGVYYPTGVAIGTILDAAFADTQYRARAQSTGGSVYNINAVCSGDLELGIAQSDRQYEAVNGLAGWDGKAKTNLRSICSLHPEAVALIVATDAGIDGVPTLVGKRVNIGNPGSGQRGNAEDVLAAFGLRLDQLAVESAKAIEAPGLLQAKQVDAFFFTAGHPNDNIGESADGARPVTIVPIVGDGVDTLLREKPYYTSAVIPQSAYPALQLTADVQTIGVRATLVASAEMDDDTAYRIAKAIFTHLDALRAVHPALESLSSEQMLQGLSAPLHPGAQRYYAEVGLH